MKKVFAVALAFLVVTSTLAGCKSSSSPVKSSTAPVTLNVWAWDPNFNIPVMQQAATIYKGKHPNVTVNVANMAKADVEAKLNTVLAAQTSTGLPDITLIEDYNAQKYLQSYPGQFADVSGTINAKDFASYKTAVTSLSGKLYGIPFDSGVVGMFYRTDIMQQAGITADQLNNITWDQFIELGKQVKAKTGNAMLSFEKNDGGLIRVMMQSAGQWYFNANGSNNLISNNALKEAMSVYKKICDSGIAEYSTDWNSWVAGINKDNCATVTTGIWIIGSIKAATAQSGKWAVAPVPRLSSTSGATNYSNLGGSSWYILAKSPNKAASLDFMKTMYDGNVDFYNTILKNQGAMGTYTSESSGSNFTGNDEFFSNTPVFKTMGEWNSHIPSIGYGKYTYEADAAIMAQMSNYLDGKTSADAALQAADKQLTNSVNK